MMRCKLFRSVFAGSLAILCTFPVYGLSTRSRTFSVEDVVGIQAGTPQATKDESSEAPTRQISIPVVITARQPDGTSENVVTQFPIAPNLVEQVKEEFGEKAPVLLRNIQGALVQGLSAPDAAVKRSCAQALPEVKASVPYRVQPGVKMPVNIEAKVAAIGQNYSRIGKAPLVVTSGNRTALKQAEAMRVKISMGENLLKLYGNKKAASQVVQAYKQAKWAGQSKAAVVEQMAQVIEEQVGQGVFISNHLREGAVDIRTKGLSKWAKAKLIESAEMVPGVRVHDESTPPHLHVDIDIS
jgi:hypothetical protein